MKAYLCSSGEKTTQICKEQLEKFGFEVVMLDEKESWKDKYLRFINTADDDCIRIDADIIPNGLVKIFAEQITKEHFYLMGQCYGYDFYKNGFGVIGITYYSKEGLDIIRENLDKIDWRRPEATAWRLPKINNRTFSNTEVCGMHGFFQTYEDLKMHEEHKLERKQIDEFDFVLAKKLLKL